MARSDTDIPITLLTNGTMILFDDLTPWLQRNFTCSTPADDAPLTGPQRRLRPWSAGQ